MIRTARLAILVVLGAASLECAQPGAVAEGSGDVPVSHDRSVLSAAELHTATDQYLYDVVQRLRPDWLRVHGATAIANGMGGNPTADPVRVYIGMVRLGGPEVLTRVPTVQAESLKFFSPSEAQLRFGPGNVNGAIQVISAPPPPSPP
jgi:hypothetical protein